MRPYRNNGITETRYPYHYIPLGPTLNMDSPERLSCLSQMEQEMKLRNLSRKTIKNYLFHTRRFLRFTNKSTDTITESDIRKYVHYLFRDDGSNYSSVRQCLGSLNFLFNIVLKKDLLLNMPYPKRERRLPTVLTREEISSMLSSTANPKHRLLLKLIYSCGLRVSEAVKIKVTDLDLDNRTLHIRCGKGKQDRIVPIPQSLCQEIRKFILPSNQNPYIFTSRPGRGGHLTTMSVSMIVKKAAGRASINKPVHPHTLRHSFATHLLDQGTDIRYIQEFLGHKRITTTELYTQVSKVSLMGIMNPLDKLPQSKPSPSTQ